MLNTSNSSLRFNPFQTTIRGPHGERRFHISTAYWDEGFCDPDELWETMVFPYFTDGESGEECIDFCTECEQYRCSTYSEALEQHFHCVFKYSLTVVPEP